MCVCVRVGKNGVWRVVVQSSLLGGLLLEGVKVLMEGRWLVIHLPVLYLLHLYCSHALVYGYL